MSEERFVKYSPPTYLRKIELPWKIILTLPNPDNEGNTTRSKLEFRFKKSQFRLDFSVEMKTKRTQVSLTVSIRVTFHFLWRDVKIFGLRDKMALSLSETQRCNKLFLLLTSHILSRTLSLASHNEFRWTMSGDKTPQIMSYDGHLLGMELKTFFIIIRKNGSRPYVFSSRVVSDNCFYRSAQLKLQTNQNTFLDRFTAGDYFIQVMESILHTISQI